MSENKEFGHLGDIKKQIDEKLSNQDNEKVDKSGSLGKVEGKVEGQLGKTEGQLGKVEGQLGKTEGNLGKVEGQLGKLEGDSNPKKD